jgi:Ca2+-transporting ATPase
MREAPRSTEEGLLSRRDYFGILYVGVVMGAAAVALYAISPQTDDALARTRAMAFSLLALSPLFHAFSCRSPLQSIFQMRPLVSVPLLVAIAASAAIHLVAVLVPGLRPVFRTFAMDGNEWALLLGLAALIIPAVELAKVIYRRLHPEEARAPASSQRAGA